MHLAEGSKDRSKAMTIRFRDSSSDEVEVVFGINDIVVNRFVTSSSEDIDVDPYLEFSTMICCLSPVPTASLLACTLISGRQPSVS
jgi:hypothetical protein